MVSADEIEIGEMLTGQLSIARETYERLGGFDGSFTREGLFGGEDTDFGYRARQAGLRVVFDPEAVTHQYYNVDPGHYLRREFEAARSSHELLLKYPDQADRFGSIPDFKRRRDRWLLDAIRRGSRVGQLAASCGRHGTRPDRASRAPVAQRCSSR